MINCSWPILDSHLARVWGHFLPVEQQLDLLTELLNAVNNIICNRIDGNKRVQISQFKPNGISHSYQLDQSISGLRVAFFISNAILIEIMKANSGDPDQTPCLASSDLGLRCLPMPHKKDARLKWFNRTVAGLRFKTHLKKRGLCIYANDPEIA